MKAFTFLGLGKYENTIYIKHDGKENCESALFPLAVSKLYRPDNIIAFITPKVKEVKEEDLKTLSHELGEKFTTVDIPDGNSTDELWDIFTKCVDADVVEENDEIILDITHTFRPSGACCWLEQFGLYTFRLSEALENHILATIGVKGGCRRSTI